MALYVSTKGWGVDWRDEFGVRHRKLVGSKEAALAMDARLRESTSQARAQAGRFTASLTLTCSQAIEYWQASYASSPRTKAHDAQRLSILVRDLLDPPIASLTPKLLATWSAKRAQELSPYTLAHDHLLIRRWLEGLVRHGMLPVNPATGLSTRCPPPSPGLVLTYEQEAQVLAAVTPKIRAKLILALDTGARRGEIAALRKNHWNQAEQVLTIWSTKTRNLRHIPLTRRAREELQALTQGLLPDALLFSYGGRPIKTGADFLKKLWPRVGFRFRFHDLRHTFATRCAEVCPNPFAVAALLGHSSRSAMTVLHQAALGQTTTLYIHPQLSNPV